MKSIWSGLILSTSLLLLPGISSGQQSESVYLGGQEIARATFTPHDGGVSVFLQNLWGDPTSVANLISGLRFDVVGISGSGLLSTVNSGDLVSFSATGNGQNGIVTPNYNATGDHQLQRWTANETGSRILLTTLSGGSPSLLIIGPGPYQNVNASIIGDNPSVNGSATFDISIAGLLPDSDGTFDNIKFENIFVRFGTGPTIEYAVPDGGLTIALLGFALLGVGALRKRVAR